MDEWLELRRAVDQLKVSLIRTGIVPIYRTLRFRRTASAWADLADRIEARRSGGGVGGSAP